MYPSAERPAKDSRQRVGEQLIGSWYLEEDSLILEEEEVQHVRKLRTRGSIRVPGEAGEKGVKCYEERLL